MSKQLPPIKRKHTAKEREKRKKINPKETKDKNKDAEGQFDEKLFKNQDIKFAKTMGKLIAHGIDIIDLDKMFHILDQNKASLDEIISFRKKGLSSTKIVEQFR